MTVYAQWTPTASDYYNVIYSAVDAQVGTVPIDDTDYSQNETVTISNTEPTRAGIHLLAG